MKWRALAVAMLGLSVTLAACSLQHEWDTYCGYPGRCANFDGGGTIPIDIAQSSVNRRIVLTGGHLADASVVEVRSATWEDAGNASIFSSAFGEVQIDVSVNPGVPVGTQLTLHVAWDRPNDESLDSIPLMVTAITVADGGDDDAGFGTPGNPYASLRHANDVAGYGDTIQLGAGRFAGIHPAASCNPSSGLKPGVKVLGDPGDASVVEGPGLCGFNLSEGNQEVRQLTVTLFSEGIRASSGTLRPVVSNVTVTGCDAGVVATPGAWLLLDTVELRANDFGLRTAGADVVMKDGGISLSSSNGLWMTGNGGRLVLNGVNVNNNAGTFTADTDAGAGILITADGGKVTLGPGTHSSNNGRTGITVNGLSNEVTLDGVTLEGADDIGLLVKDRDAGVLLRNTSISNDFECIRTEGFRFFNGGTGPDGGYGGNTLACFQSSNINDVRTSGPDMDFSTTSLNGQTPPPGTIVDSTSSNIYGIQFGGTTRVNFH